MFGRRRSPAARPSQTDTTTPLSVRGLTVAYRQQPVLMDVDYDAPPGGLVAVCGPNGAGKSTFINAIMGLAPTLTGEITSFGQPVARRRRQIAFVPQRQSVDWDFPASALDVVTMGLYPHIGLGRPVRARHRDAARACLAQVGLADLADRQIGQLSGGQQQRIFLARALAQDADIYLLDEPMAGVDATTERTIADVMADLAHHGRTVLAVHHDLQTVPDYFRACLLLNVVVVAAGELATTFTRANLAATYGGRLDSVALAAVAERAAA